MQFLTVSRIRENSGKTVGELRQAEVRRAKELYSEGHLRQLWHRGDVPGACLVWEAENETGLREMLDSLPFVQAGILDFSVIPLRPFLGFVPEKAS